MPWERELQAGLEACEKARQNILDTYDAFQPVHDARAEIKLSVDVETQETLLQHLSATFAQDGFVAEEDTPTLAEIRSQKRSSERTWIVDPIDGTRGFAKKNGEFSVMVGLIAQNTVVVGVVMEPVQARLTYAAKGEGCWTREGNGSPIRCRVRGNSVLGNATIVVSHLKPGSNAARQVQALAPARVMETYSAGVKLAIVARGEADLYYNYYPNFHDWDVCAGHVLVEEAGGRVSVLSGDSVRYGPTQTSPRDGLLASNGALHDAALTVLRKPVTAS